MKKSNLKKRFNRNRRYPRYRSSSRDLLLLNGKFIVYHHHDSVDHSVHYTVDNAVDDPIHHAIHYTIDNAVDIVGREL